MDLIVLNKIKENEKLYEYLKKHSLYYIYLNRNPNFYDDLLKKYKKYRDQNNINKINDTLENIDLLTNVIKFVD